VTDIVSQMNSASQQQSKTTQTVHRAIIELDDSTQQNAALVEQAAVASQSTTQEADNLIYLIDFFDVPDELPSNVTALRKTG
jgi:methyl-accepting chemotaxis protein